MTHPTSTYRIQFRNGMTFDRARSLVPYLMELGISHLYASPIFTATTGSTHGYDVTDANEIDPAIGGRVGFERLVEILQQAGLQLILDIVPNHMAASLENAWWRSVLELGANSPYARHFDIDWRERLTLPELDGSFEAVLAGGAFRLAIGARLGKPGFAHGDRVFPLRPESVADILERTGGEEAGLARLSDDPMFMRQLHENQHWQLTDWRQAAQRLTYRRFFEVTGLVGVRVEDPTVFADTHRLIIDLVRTGQVQGLRIDHIDGLADPRHYLEELRDRVGPDTYIVVEKILGPGESLPKSWPISGTTGYEFTTALSHLFIDPAGLKTLDAAYRAIAPDSADFQTGLRQAKSLMVDRNFTGERTRLVELAAGIFPDAARGLLETAIREILIAFPVYRTYGVRGVLDGADQAILEKVLTDAKDKVADAHGVELIGSLLSGAIEGDRAIEFRTRLQQLSGPVMAKAMEDTLFYRFNRLLAANEVGGEPAAAPEGIAHFHVAMKARADMQPFGLSATSTHDTKRGEDARARLYALSEHATDWVSAFHRQQKDPRLDSNVQWMLHQALAGIWPGEARGPDSDLQQRFIAYTEKAIREAKVHTDWAAPNAAYETAATAFAAVLSSPDNRVFIENFNGQTMRVLQGGYLNSLAQTLIKLTAPGVPDIYQGAEGFDLSLVDPDNRRPVDFDRLRELSQRDPQNLQEHVEGLKQRMVSTVLHLRKEQAALFGNGSYVALETTGSRAGNLVAFARYAKETFAITLAPRLLSRHLIAGTISLKPGFWEDTAVLLPPQFQGKAVNLLTGETIAASTEIRLDSVLDKQPFALLVLSQISTSV